LPHYKCLLGEKFRDEFLDFRAGRALKSVPLRQEFLGRSATNTGRFSLVTFFADAQVGLEPT